MFETPFRLAGCARAPVATLLTSLFLSASLSAAHLTRSRPYLTVTAGSTLQFARPLVAVPLPPVETPPRGTASADFVFPDPASLDFTFDDPVQPFSATMSFDTNFDSMYSSELDPALSPAPKTLAPQREETRGARPPQSDRPESELIPDLPPRIPVKLEDVLPFFAPSGPASSRATYRRT